MSKEKTLALPLISQKTLTIILSLLSFFVPFSLGHPQLLVGTIVNAAILAAALYLPLNLSLPIIFLPSIAVLSRGLIFGPFTKFLVIFLPAIWLGNWLLYLFFRKTYLEKKWPYFLSLIISAGIKTLFLFSFALILFNLKIVPPLFLKTMGWIQLITAVSGGILVFLSTKFQAPNSKNFYIQQT